MTNLRTIRAVLGKVGVGVVVRRVGRGVLWEQVWGEVGADFLEFKTKVFGLLDAERNQRFSKFKE